MAVIVKKSYLYLLDNVAGIYIPTKLPLNDEVEGTTLYLEKLIDKCLKNAAAKPAKFNDGSATKQLFLDYRMRDLTLADVGYDLAGRLYDLKTQYELFTASDFFLCEVEMLNVEYIVGLELVCKAAFTHEVKQTDEGVQNNLLLHEAMLPAPTGRSGRFFMVNRDNLNLTILEDRVKFEGEDLSLFAEDLLGTTTDISIKEAVHLARSATEKIVEKHNLDELEVIPMFHQAITEVIHTGAELDFEAIGGEIFKEHEAIATDYAVEIQNHGIEKPIVNSTGAKVRTPKMQKIKTDTGIEVSFPFDYYQNKDYLEIINTPNGRISIEIKNVGNITNKQ
ncbi:MAG TPA: nucleoid-associated protein [Firmicutes bacterium]|nr:nucleoid-associated protein [Bacillota bacterium]